MAIAGWVFAVSNEPIWLAMAAIFGTISPSGKEVGPFLSIEQAILPETTQDQHRTTVFSAYNLIGSLCGALGALAVGLPSLFSIPQITGYRFLVWGYVICAVVMMVVFALLSPAIETKNQTVSQKRVIGVRRSRGIVAKLAGLFALDAFAGGFIVQSIVAYWFYLRYKTDLNALGGIFFGTNLLAALSFLAAPAIARRFGLLNTMVFTHLPSNILLLLVPLMPNLELAVVMLLVRNLLSQLDVPTRQSYTMAVVDAEERAASAGILSVARNAGAALAPLFTGAVSGGSVLGFTVLVGRRAEDYLRPLDLRGLSEGETAGGGKLIVVSSRPNLNCPSNSSKKKVTGSEGKDHFVARTSAQIGITSPPIAVNIPTSQGGHFQNIRSPKARSPSPKSAGKSIALVQTGVYKAVNSRPTTAALTPLRADGRPASSEAGPKKEVHQ